MNSSILIGVIILIVITGIIVSLWLEYRGFNHGECPYCWGKLRHFDTDSQGGRGYCCDICDYHTWVSYGIIDKDFKEEE